MQTVNTAPASTGGKKRKLKQRKPRFVAFILSLLTMRFIWTQQDGRFVLLDEAQIDKLLPGYSQEPLPVRERLVQRFLRKRCKVKLKVKWNRKLVNSSGKVPCEKTGKKRKATRDDLRVGAGVFLSIPGLFAEKAVGTALMSDLLCGVVCTRLKEAFPDARFITVIQDSSTPLFETFSTVFNAVVTKTEWVRKRLRIVRCAVINMAGGGITGRHLWDGGFVQRTWKGNSATAHLSFRDTVVLVANASKAQVKESQPYLQGCFSLFLGKNLPVDEPYELIPAPSPGESAEEALQLLKDHRFKCSALLEKWHRRCRKDPYWAERIEANVRSSFTGSGALWGASDTLRREIRAAVLADFLDFVRANGFLTADEIDDWHSKVTAQQAPPDDSDSVLPPADTADAVIAVLRRYVQEHGDNIIPDDAPASAEAAKAGVWRYIAGKTKKEFLMLTEQDFANLYRRLAKEYGYLPNLSANYKEWLEKIEKDLRDHRFNKVDGSSFRFRYKLIDTWQVEDYVVAIDSNCLIPNDF